MLPDGQSEIDILMGRWRESSSRGMWALDKPSAIISSFVMTSRIANVVQCHSLMSLKSTVRINVIMLAFSQCPPLSQFVFYFTRM